MFLHYVTALSQPVYNDRSSTLFLKIVKEALPRISYHFIHSFLVQTHFSLLDAVYGHLISSTTIIQPFKTQIFRITYTSVLVTILLSAGVAFGVAIPSDDTSIITSGNRVVNPAAVTGTVCTAKGTTLVDHDINASPLHNSMLMIE